MPEWKPAGEVGEVVTRILALASTFFVALSSFLGLSCQEGYPGPAKPIVMAYAPFESTALVWVAEEAGFFKLNGLDVTPRKYDTGAGALNGMIKGEADIAVGVAEFPVVGKAFLKEGIRAIGTTDKAEFVFLVGRKDRGVGNVPDLKGKRVGTTLGTVAHFHLGRVLNLNGMNTEDVTVVDLKTPAEWVDAVANGDVDAVATAQPYVNYARDRLGANGVVLSIQSRQPIYGLIVSSKQWIGENPELARRFLKSLLQAEEYLETHAKEAKEIVQEALNLNPSYIEAVWSQNLFSVSLEQSLILAMEQEARWMIGNNLTPEKTVPNFLDFIYSDGLKSVKPGAVNIAGD